MKTEMKNMCDNKTPTFPWLTSAPHAELPLHSKCGFLLVFFTHTLPSMSLSLFLCLFYEAQHFPLLFPSSHRGFCNLLPWLTWAGKWALQYFMTLTWRSEQTQLTPNCTFNPRASLSQINFCLSPTSAFLLTLVKTPPMCKSKCNVTLRCTFSYPRWFWTAVLL